MPTDRIDEFVARKSSWIIKKLAEQNRRNDVLSSVISFDSVLYHGAFYRVEYTPNVKSVRMGSGVVLMPEKYKDNKQAAMRAFAAMYKRLASRELGMLLAEAATRTGLAYSAFDITNARTKWGSCDGNCNIRINWRMIMLDAELVEYVLIHELAHTRHHDHSAAFWAEVGRLMPRYAAARKRLKTYAVLTSLYR